jgi:hypothetical protein
MEEAGTVDADAATAAGSAPEELLSPDTAQTDAANKLLAEQWAALVG